MNTTRPSIDPVAWARLRESAEQRARELRRAAMHDAIDALLDAFVRLPRLVRRPRLPQLRLEG